MSTKDVEFSRVELWVVMKLLLLQKKATEEIHEHMLQTLSDKCPSSLDVKKCCANFQYGYSETKDTAISERPLTVLIVDHVHDPDFGR